MKLTAGLKGWHFTRDSGEEIKFTYAEMTFIGHELEKLHWTHCISMQLDYDSDSIDFSKLSREEFIDLCVADIENQWASCSDLEFIPNYRDVVFNVANENEIWRDD